MNAPTADVWVSDLSDNGMVPFASTPNGSQVTVMPASTAKRMHLKFGSLTLATVDIQAGALPPPSGTITASPGTCSIAPGSATCPATISWNTYNATAKVSVWMTDLNGNEEESFSAGPVGTKSVPIATPGMRFHLKNGSQLLATVDVHGNPAPLQPSVPYRASKTETIEYHNDPSKWVMGQVERSLVNGIEVSRTVFDTASVLPLQSYSFGKLKQTLSYYTDGNLATFKDGNNNVTTLSNWYRGVPRTIQFPATAEAPSGATQTAVVNDKGWITAATDENGYKTCYGYDAMGRIGSITYPSESTPGICDTSTWAARYFDFHPLGASDWRPAGIATGQWVRRTWQGNYRNIAYMDAMWRPVLNNEYDESNQTSTLRTTGFAYDSSGRQSFASYPTAAGTAGTTGTRTYYDALDRVTRVEQDSELGVLASSTAYLAGFQTQVTNPRGLQVTTDYMAYDQPTTDLPVGITTSADTATEIHRDVFGKPTLLVRRNHANTQRVERRYVYDGYQQLCKTIEPETGATVMDYDGAGNLKWSASGHIDLLSPTDCNNAEGYWWGRRVDRSYDARNRLTTLAFPDGRGNQSWAYTPDGLPTSITTYNDPSNGSPVINTYTYNKRRMLIGESVAQPGYSWGLGYSYDPNGNMRWQSYPSGLVLDYAPNALGQPTQVSDQSTYAYATGVQYYPNGAIKQFTYGNGIVHTMQQNARQLPSRSIDSGGVLDLAYSFDANANVNHIWDYAQDTGNGFYGRWMTYDGLDRLTDAGSCSFGGDCWHRFTYDALDNLKSWKLPGVKDYAEYVYTNNRLTNIKNTAGATVVGLDYDVQGNLSNKNGQAYGFDYGNRLRDVPGKESYRYDGLGRRVLNWRPADNTTTLSQYSQSGQVLYNENTKTLLKTEHIYLGGSLLANRETIWGTSTVTAKYQHTDALGSPVAVTNMAGAVIERTSYEPYGAAINKPAYDGIGYTGHVMDGATGLTYMQQRYYDPICGCFLSMDPVAANPNTGASFNRYNYANNNPYKFTDPDGRAPCKLCVEIKSAVVKYVASKTVAFGNAMIDEGKAALQQGVQNAKNFVSQRDLVVSAGAAGMIGTPIKGNGITPGLTIVGDASVVANLSSGQVGIQGNVGAVPSVGGGGVVAGNFSAGLNEGPLQSGISTTNTAFAQVTAVTATGTPVDVGGAVQWSNGGGNVSVGFKPGVGSYIGAGGGQVMTGTLVTPPLKKDDR
ncbi:RHS repeat-associated core domain-containing protein [Pseudoxanthomonas sp. CF125]|uniref:RHS repeat domain-containing protein n=1 Tax=Pseudoxanthomonas sp. CF125 TaxID=1855303 RepID=UPI00159FD571|nr:RHS repeat-associated core domain-containing protein [Pseudoxanthomonas sp. CF125]